MTLQQAQKQYDDALQMKCEHRPYCMTETQMRLTGEGLRGKEQPSKVLFVKVGKCVSRVISSRQAYLDIFKKESILKLESRIRKEIEEHTVIGKVYEIRFYEGEDTCRAFVRINSGDRLTGIFWSCRHQIEQVNFDNKEVILIVKLQNLECIK
jgi:hypothetical protein